MRSKRAFIGAAMIALSCPLALGVGLFGGGAETVIHVVMGTGFVVFALSVFDVALPRCINVVAAVAAATSGAIFLMQGVSDLTHVEALRYVAFDVMGIGWAVMLVVVGLEVAAFVTLLLGAPMGSVKFLILLPFVWLLFESAKRGAARSGAASHSRCLG